ncbi:hypothetical protein [Inhella crocodyli]|uniref:GIY-YIG domain-containing protein n=1 Tax=Inhella crocodyli TaxID=2499851 RepID=A0A3S3T3C2_9BURK|nr:hypothetical protein [Inhella crocodyli]RVT82407.1 hypothetical protein EOD73_16875 [Inhella crocodyli]
MIDFEIKLKSLWRSKDGVDIERPFLYFISVKSSDGAVYTYVGKARDEARLHEYRRNMLKIHARRERGKSQNYRAVHFALYSALRNDWEIDFFPLENCEKGQLNELERQRIRERCCNLNGARTWRVAQLDQVSLHGLVRTSAT